MFRRFSVGSLAFMCMLQFACSPSEEVAEHSFSISVENGVTIASTTGGPLYTEELFTYEKLVTLEEDFNVPESLFDRPDWFAADHRDQYYLPHRSDCRIQVFDYDGQYIRSIGRRGLGPGELTVIDFQSLIEDTLTVFDRREQRTTRFLTDGTLLEVFGHPAEMGRLSALERDSRGRFIGVCESTDIQPERVIQSIGILTSSSEGDTICWNATERIPVAYLSSKLDASTRYTGYDFGPILQSHYDPITETYLLTTGVDPIINWYDADGRLKKVYSVGRTPQAITASERSEIESYHRRQIAELEGEEKAREEQELQNLKFLPFKAHWGSVLVDDAGYLWLESREGNVATGSGRWSKFRVISPDGEYIGDTSWPLEGDRVGLGSTVMQGRLLCLDLDLESGQDTPIVYRIIPRIPGFKYP